MFQDSLLIIKSDYMAKRKSLLIHLLQKGFQIQGQRKIKFTPELAAEFYQDICEDPSFMFQVILLSKGPSEAVILAKENAVEDLLNSMVCYFGNSVEMEKNVHVTKCLGKVRKDISFIFPNYIFEPIAYPDQMEFSKDKPFVASLISGVYDIVTQTSVDPHKSWKEKLANFLLLSNKDLPQVSNQCSWNSSLNMREIGQQTKVTAFKHDHNLAFKHSKSSTMDLDTDGTSLNLTTSSCVSCSDFNSNDDCLQQGISLMNMIKMKTAPLAISESSSEVNEIIPTEKQQHVEEESEVILEEEYSHEDHIDVGSVGVIEEKQISKSQLSNIYSKEEVLSVTAVSNEKGAGDANSLIDDKSLSKHESVLDTRTKDDTEKPDNLEDMSPGRESVEDVPRPEVNVTTGEELDVNEIENTNEVQIPQEEIVEGEPENVD
ncbi:uncharacterized protein [Musca autumnalis]|uniref:uncharacterized protein n=1 Tax=Musca autumnalis TaxID=221902 RepID=UPI003CF847DE